MRERRECLALAGLEFGAGATSTLLTAAGVASMAAALITPRLTRRAGLAATLAVSLGTAGMLLALMGLASTTAVLAFSTPGSTVSIRGCSNVSPFRSSLGAQRWVCRRHS